MGLRNRSVIIILLFITANASPAWLKAGAPPDTVSLPFFHGDNPWAQVLDSSLHIQFFEYDLFTCDSAVLNDGGFSAGQVPQYPDSFYIKAFRAFQSSSPMDCRFNEDVRSYIEFYTIKRRMHLSKVLALSQIYFPVFEEYLDQYNLPVELKYLPVIESALNPVAVSRAGAGGLWQFMPSTGRIYGLGITQGYDERSDPYLSTEAACRHLRGLYDMFGDWLLAIAAYNSGSGNVLKAMRRSGGSTFWEISPFLPRETRGYVPAFIAVSYVMQHPGLFNLYPFEPVFKSYEVDTLHVNFPVSFRVLSDSLGITAADLGLLNPAYTNGFVPASTDEPRILVLPVDMIGPFLRNEALLRDFAVSGKMSETYGPKLYISSYRQTVHVVRRGESLGLIAKRYGTTVTRIKSLNGLHSNTIHPGQRLVVSTPLPAQPEQSLIGPRRDPYGYAYEYHIARGGETLSGIASQYPGIGADDLANLNNMSVDEVLATGRKVRLRYTMP